MVDNDRQPFRVIGQAAFDGTGLIRETGCHPALRYVTVRVDPREPKSLSSAVAFIAQTPARIVVVPVWSSRAEHWRLFRQAAESFKDVLFIVAAGDEGRDIDQAPTWPAAFKLANMLVVTSGIGDAERLSIKGNRGPETIDAVVLQGSVETTSQPSEPASPSAWAAMNAAWAIACTMRNEKRQPAADELKVRFLAVRRQKASFDNHRLFDPVCRAQGSARP
jgi:hypothetical protein